MKTENENVRHYLSELPHEEVKKLILYPSEISDDLYGAVAEDNGEYASDLIKEILGKDYNTWTKYDDCSYTWWLNIKPGQYANVLDITTYDYFSEDDTVRVKELQRKVKELKDKVDNLEDCDDYYDKIDKWEDTADEYADEIIQIVVKLIKQAEEVTDEQLVDFFEMNELGDDYYYINDDKSKVFRDYTKSYKTGA